MKENTAVLVSYRLERARDALASAQILLQEKKLFSTVNRIYYAMFYAASALLLTKGLSFSKHTSVISNFSRVFVNTGLLEKNAGKFFSRMFKHRQRGDYQDLVEFNRADVEEWLDMAQQFV